MFPVMTNIHTTAPGGPRQLQGTLGLQQNKYGGRGGGGERSDSHVQGFVRLREKIVALRRKDAHKASYSLVTDLLMSIRPARQQRQPQQ